MKILNSKIAWLLFLGLAVGIYCLANMLHWQLDLTAEKRFTLSEPTKKMLRQLDDKVEIDVLLQGDNLPAGFKQLQNSTNLFLERCKAEGKNKFDFHFVDPETFISDSVNYPLLDSVFDKKEWLKSVGVKQNEITKSATKAVFNYPVALVRYHGQVAPVNLLQGQSSKNFLNPNAANEQLQTINNAEALLEYQFDNAVYSLTKKTTPIVAYATGNGEPQNGTAYDISTTLQSKYRFFLFNVQLEPIISDSIKTLVFVKPTEKFSDEEKLKIDQYVMRGGKVMFLLDVLNADLDSLRRSGKDFTAFDRGLNLDDLLFKYGVRINQDLVEDLQCDVLPQVVGNIGGKPQIELLQWPYFPLLYPSSNHPIVKNMDAVVMQFPNSIDTVQAVGIKKTVLLSTSNTSRIIGSPAIVTVEVLKQMDNASLWKQKNIPLAVLLEGPFKSLYANRISQAQMDTMKKNGADFMPESNTDGKILVTGDGDWVLNGYNKTGPMPMGVNQFTNYNFANKDFLTNSLEYMTDESGILQTRGKEYVLRMLDPKKIEADKTFWQWLNIGLPLVVILLVGMVFQWRRKKKYSMA